MNARSLFILVYAKGLDGENPLAKRFLGDITKKCPQRVPGEF
jgi:hypothetical protein